MLSTRLLPRAALLACAAALITAAGASGAICEDCEPSGGGGTGSTQPIPNTVITSGPETLYRDTTPTFKMKSDVSNVRYRCRIIKGDVVGAAYDCGTTGTAGLVAEHTLPEQADGTYTMSIAACKDYTGTTTTTKCDASPATHAYTIDTVRPSLVVSGTSAPVYSRTPPTFTLTSDSPDLKYFRCGIDGASSWVECGPSFTWPENAAEGLHEVYIHSYDHAYNLSGNMERRIWIKDTIQPVVTLTGPSGPTNDATPTFAFSAEDADSDLLRQCHLSSFGRVPVARVDCSAGSWTPSSALPDGEYELLVQVQDRAGNWSPMKTKVFTVDTAAPALGDIVWNPTTKRLTYTADDGPLACRFDAGSEFACGTDVDASQLADGDHTLVVTLKDAAGNATTKSKSFRIGAPPATGGETPTGGGSTGGDVSGGGDVLGGGGQGQPVEQSGGPVLPPSNGPQPPTGGQGPANPVTTPKPKPAANKKCRMVTKKVRGKKRRVKVCTKKNPARAAAPRRA